ncbi:MAG: MCP four helix bundle domain-containing protein [Nitrospirota bacterium]
MFIHKMKITHKVIIVVVTGIIMLTMFAAWGIIGKKETRKLSRIYNKNMIPLDYMRNIQSIFNEEYG